MLKKGGKTTAGKNESQKSLRISVPAVIPNPTDTTGLTAKNRINAIPIASLGEASFIKSTGKISKSAISEAREIIIFLVLFIFPVPLFFSISKPAVSKRCMER